MPNKKSEIDFNIEFTHLYVNESFNSEHQRSALIARDEINKLEKQKKSFVSSVLVDDYNPSESFFVEKEFLTGLEALGMSPDYLAYESKLTLWVDILLDEMNGKIQHKYMRYLISKGKAPCSLLVAIWHLIRLGALEMNHPSLLKQGGFFADGQEKPFFANELITILPHRYDSVEKRAMEIISATRFKDYTKKMHYIFF